MLTLDLLSEIPAIPLELPPALYGPDKISMNGSAPAALHQGQRHRRGQRYPIPREQICSLTRQNCHIDYQEI